jgi:hypothetical protein
VGARRKCRRRGRHLVGRGVNGGAPAAEPSVGPGVSLGGGLGPHQDRMPRLSAGTAGLALRRIRVEWTAAACAVIEGMRRTRSDDQPPAVGAAKCCASRRPRRHGGALRRAGAAWCQCYPAHCRPAPGFPCDAVRGTSPFGSRRGRSRQRTYGAPKGRTTQSCGRKYCGRSSRWRARIACAPLSTAIADSCRSAPGSAFIAQEILRGGPSFIDPSIAFRACRRRIGSRG